MSDDGSFEGRCTCGDVRFRLTSRPMIVHACHCTECQRLSGGAFAINALIEADRVETLAGDPVPVPVHQRQGADDLPLPVLPGGAVEPLSRRRRQGLLCPGRNARAPCAPAAHIYTSTRVPWLALPENVTAVAEYYAARDVWPAESLERRRRLKGA